MHNHRDNQDDALIQTLLECARACEYCASACLKENDPNMARCIEVDRDCADLCFQAARLLERNSELAHKFLAVCEEACRICSEECSKHDHDHCKECAEISRKCAEACHQHHENVTLA